MRACSYRSRPPSPPGPHNQAYVHRPDAHAPSQPLAPIAPSLGRARWSSRAPAAAVQVLARFPALHGVRCSRTCLVVPRRHAECGVAGDGKTALRKPPPAESSFSAPRRSPRILRRPVRIRPQRPESVDHGRPRGKRRPRMPHTARTRTGQGQDMRRNRGYGKRERRVPLGGT